MRKAQDEQCTLQWRRRRTCSPSASPSSACSARCTSRGRRPRGRACPAWRPGPRSEWTPLHKRDNRWDLANASLGVLPAPGTTCHVSLRHHRYHHLHITAYIIECRKKKRKAKKLQKGVVLILIIRHILNISETQCVCVVGVMHINRHETQNKRRVTYKNCYVLCHGEKWGGGTYVGAIFPPATYPFSLFQGLSQKGSAIGYAGLDNNVQVPILNILDLPQKKIFQQLYQH